jgi:hypothetical protein
LHSKIKKMQELIDRIVKEAGITPEQATISLETIKTYVKENFPMLGGAVDNMFAQKPGDASANSW